MKKDIKAQDTVEETASSSANRQIVRLFDAQNKLKLAGGESLGPIDVAYETFGALNDKKDNAILLCHALSGDSHVTSNKRECEKAEQGWWEVLVGPGKAFDTEKYFVICTNSLGGCMGTTGPSSINPETGKPYGLTFPMITIGDQVDLQKHLIEHLGVTRLLSVAGGSMGGMQTLRWAVRYPDKVASVIPIATTSRLSAQSIAFDAVGRHSILRDENFQNGAYYESGRYPARGLAVARMIGHITYLSEEAMHKKFGRRLQNTDAYNYEFDSEFSVESYLDYQGTRFVDRFDANTYVYFSKAMDYFDLSQPHNSLSKALLPATCPFLIISFDSDWLFTPKQNQEIANALIANDQQVNYCNIHCPYGHDSFLLESEVQGGLISGFLGQRHRNVSQNKSSSITVTDDRPATSMGQPQPVTSRFKKGSIFAGERVDHRLIEQLIAPDSTVLDLGCGDGLLMRRLSREKNIKGVGLTLNEQDVIACCVRGVCVVQYDLDETLDRFVDASYDTVLLSQALQVIKQPEKVLQETLRIGRQVIVSFPNFAYWRYRFQILFRGKTPIGKALPDTWYDKTAVNYLSINDFEEFVHRRLKAVIRQRICLSSTSGKKVSLWPNGFADEAIFVIANQD